MTALTLSPNNSNGVSTTTVLVFSDAESLNNLSAKGWQSVIFDVLQLSVKSSPTLQLQVVQHITWRGFLNSAVISCFLRHSILLTHISSAFEE